MLIKEWTRNKSPFCFVHCASLLSRNNSKPGNYFMSIPKEFAWILIAGIRQDSTTASFPDWPFSFNSLFFVNSLYYSVNSKIMKILIQTKSTTDLRTKTLRQNFYNRGRFFLYHRNTITYYRLFLNYVSIKSCLGLFAVIKYNIVTFGNAF